MDRDNFVIRLILRARDEGFARASQLVDRSMSSMRRSVNDAQGAMRRFDNQVDKSKRGLDNLNRSARDTQRSINAIRGPTDAAAASTRRWNIDIDRANKRLIELRRRVDDNRESIARFDNEIRGMRVLVIAAQMQALTSAVLALGGALTAVAGSAVAAGSALGGALAAGAAQAIPAIGLLAATVARLKSVFDVVQQVQDAQKASATQATSATNQQADSMDKLRNAADGVRDAQQRVREAQLGVAEAHREARRELQDLIMAQRQAALQEEESTEKLRLLRSQGVTGFELRGAELDADQSRVGARRAGQDLRRVQEHGSEGVRNAVRGLREAQEALARSRRSNANAIRDINDAGAGTVAAARQLDFMQAQLSGAERRLVRSILNLRDTWKRVARPITDTIVESFTRGVDRAEKAIQRPTLIRAFQGLADEAGAQMDRATRFLTGDRAIGFFARQSRELSRNLQPATTAAIRLSRAFMNIADAAAPTLSRLIRDFAGFTGDIERVTENKGALQSLFQFGEVQLHAWLDLARAIGETIKAVMAPGGDLQSGAASSGLRIIRDFTLDFRRAAEWINTHPMEVDKFFGDSEQSLRRILDLLYEIVAAMFRIFDPESIDAFADIVHALIPAFEQIAETFGFISKIIAEILQNPAARLIFQTGFGLLVFQRIGSKFIGLFSSIGAAALGVGTTLLTWSQRLDRSALTLGTMATQTGGLRARIVAATAAWRGYGAAATAAAAQTAAATGAVVGGAATGRMINRFNSATGKWERVPASTVPVNTGTSAVSTARQVGLAGQAGALAVGGIRAAGRFALPLVAFMGAIDFLSSSGGPLKRFGAAIEGATFGLVKLPKRVSDDEAALRDRNRAAGRPDAFIFGGVREEAGIRRAIREGDIDALKRYRRELIAARKDEQEMFGKGDEDVKKMTAQINRLNEAIKGGADVTNKPLFEQALGRIRDLGATSVNSLKEVRDNMRITFTFINDAAEKGSENWRIAMVSNTQAGVNSIIEAATNGRIKWSDAFEDMTRITRRQMRLISGHIKNLSGEARDALSENFRTARVRAERQLGRLETATGESLKIIKRLFANELASYGFTASQVRSIIRARRDEDDRHSRGSRSFEGGSNSIDLGQASGGWARRPMGGFVGAMGERGQDAIRTVLGRGEAVLNWGQQRVVEPALNAAYGFGLDELFRRTRGLHAGHKEVGYARGGRIPIVPVPGFPGEQANRAILDEIAFITKRFGLRLTDAYGPGHQSPGHTIYGTAADFAGPDRAMNAAVRFLARRYKVLYDGRFGSTAWPGHGPSTVAGSNAHIHVEFGTKDLGAATGNAQPFNIPRVEVVGAGPMGEVANAGLAKVRRGAILRARRAIERALGAGVEGAELGAGAAPPGQLRSWLRRALQITGHLSPGNLSALYGRAMQESGGDPRAVNNWDSNAAAGTPSKGLLQTIGPTFAAYALPGMKNIFNPIHNAVAAIRYMYAKYGHIVGPSSTGYATGGELPGPLGTAQSIIAHGKEWILNERQKGRLSALTGMSVGKLKGALGFTGGPTSFQGGGEVEDRSFELPGFLPQTPGGTRGLIGRLFRFIKKFGNVNENIDILTRENGLLDLLSNQLEEATQRIESAITRGTFRIKNNRVVRRHSDIWVSQETLKALEDTGRQLRNTDRSLLRGLRIINNRIRALREGGLTDREQGIIEDLRVQRRNLTGRRETNRQSRAENLRARFEEQEALKELLQTRFTDRLARSDRRFEIGRSWVDFQERMLAATGVIGLGRRSTIFEQRGANISKELHELTGFRDIAGQRGWTDLVNELNDRILNLTVELAENTKALFEARVEEVNRIQQISSAQTTARSRIAELQGQLGIISPDEARARMREQAEIAGAALLAQGASLTSLLNEARAAGNEAAIIELEQAILDNTIAQLENSVTLKELKGSVDGTQSFSSTAWQWFRTAIFNGSGGLLPQFQAPVGTSMQAAPVIPSSPFGAGGGGAGVAVKKVVGVEHMEITQNETFDETAYANKVAWLIDTPTV